MKKKIIIAILIIIAVIFKILNMFYVVDVTEQVIVLRFGKYVRTISKPGWYMKLPAPIETLETFDNRLLQYDSAPTEIITKDKKNLIFDNYSRWRIVDPLKFYKTVRNENNAQSRLDDIIYSILREELGNHTLSDIVSGERDSIMRVVSHKCDLKAEGYGIKIVDVRAKRVDLPQENENAVYRRMTAERERIANRYRSEGKEESTKIRAEAERKKAIILAEARKKAEIIRGKADSIATVIYAKAYNKDKQFYELLKSLEVYKKALDKNTTIILPIDRNNFLKYFGK